MPDYEILGVRFKARSDQDSPVAASDVVEFVKKQVELLQRASPHLTKEHLALLVALNMAEEKMILENEYKNSVNELQATAQKALKLIQETSPSFS